MDHSEFFIAKQAELWDRFIKNVHKCKDCPSLVKAGESDDVSIALKAKTLSCALLEPEFQLILPPGCPRKGTFELADNIANHLRRLIASYGVAADLDYFRGEFANIAGEADFYSGLPF